MVDNKRRSGKVWRFYWWGENHSSSLNFCENPVSNRNSWLYLSFPWGPLILWWGECGAVGFKSALSLQCLCCCGQSGFWCLSTCWWRGCIFRRWTPLTLLTFDPELHGGPITEYEPIRGVYIQPRFTRWHIVQTHSDLSGSEAVLTPDVLLCLRWWLVPS